MTIKYQVIHNKTNESFILSLTTNKNLLLSVYNESSLEIENTLLYKIIYTLLEYCIENNIAMDFKDISKTLKSISNNTIDLDNISIQQIDYYKERNIYIKIKSKDWAKQYTNDYKKFLLGRYSIYRGTIKLIIDDADLNNYFCNNKRTFKFAMEDNKAKMYFANEEEFETFINLITTLVYCKGIDATFYSISWFDGGVSCE